MALSLTTPNTVLGLVQPGTRLKRIAFYGLVVVLGTIALTVAAKVSVPVWPVPVTLQSFAVAALAASFGAPLAVAMVAAYLVQGALGLPVFAAGGGLAYLVGPTGGFLLGFLALAFITGRAADLGLARSPLKMLGAMLAGHAVLYGFGFAWLVAMAGSAQWIDQSDVVASAFAAAVQPFLVWDVLKMALAALTAAGLTRLVRR